MADKPTFTDNDIIKTLNSNGLYNRNQLEKYTKFSRFGYYDLYNNISNTREYLFFTKMDLHIFEPNTQNLNPELANNPFFIEAVKNYKDVLNQLQWSTRNESKSGPFVNLLSNTVRSKLDLDDIDIDSLETAANISGIKMDYPMATTDSNNMRSFSLEFEDTKNLDVYMYFRIWYEYELLRSNGLVTPHVDYILNRIIDDQMCCYKIVVGEDFETIIYYAKCWGIYPSSIPRSVFGDSLSEGPLKIPVSFKCQFVEDLDPNILSDFNKVVADMKNKYNEDLPIYDSTIAGVNGTWANTPYIITSTNNGRRVYKLKWR